MKIKNWIACVQDRGKWKEVVEKAKTFNQEVQRLEEEEEKMMGGITTRNMWTSLQKYNKLYIVASCWTVIDREIGVWKFVSMLLAQGLSNAFQPPPPQCFRRFVLH